MTTATTQTKESLLPVGGSESRSFSEQHFAYLFWALTLLSLAPFLTVRYPVITDYPNHLARWFVLFHANDPHYHFSTFYAPAWGLLPYITPDILAMGLQYVLPIDTVGRSILSLCVISVAFAAFFFLKTACPENRQLALLGILIAFNPNFLMGSISNQLSLAFCLIVVALWIRYCSRPSILTAAGVAVCLILTYLSHLIGFAVAGTVMGVYTLFQAERWKKLGVLAILSLPTLLLFVRNSGRAGASNLVAYGPASDKLKHLFFPIRLYISKPLDFVLLIAIGLAVWLLFRAQEHITAYRVWLVVCSVLLLAYFVAPATYGYGGYADRRILPFLYLFVLAAFRFPKIPRYLVVGFALLVIFRIATVERMFLGKQRELQRLSLAFDAIPRDTKVFQLERHDPRGIMGTGDIHFLDYAMIQRGLLVPSLFHLPGVQPIRLVADVYCPNVFCYVWDPKYPPDWEQVARSYDYLWVPKNAAIVLPASQIGEAIYSNDSVTVYRTGLYQTRYSRVQ